MTVFAFFTYSLLSCVLEVSSAGVASLFVTLEVPPLSVKKVAFLRRHSAAQRDGVRRPTALGVGLGGP